MTTDTDNAINQAKAQLESIQAMVARLEHAQSGCDDYGGDDCFTIGAILVDLGMFVDEYPTSEMDILALHEHYHTEDEARQRIDEDPLSVQVRSDWTDPGTPNLGGPAEYEILLMTGGPAVRIIGELDEYSQPTRARLQYQDWGTPWTELLEPRDMQALISYTSNFYFGE